MKISIVIPTLNERAVIAETVTNALTLGPAEVIVIDGNSEDGTAEVAARAGAKVAVTRTGCACQLNAGAAAAVGEALLFLHADTTLPPNAIKRVEEILSEPTVSLGAFRLGFDRDDRGTRFLTFGADLRIRLFQLPYGDQALFLRKEIFDRLGGFREIPIMEDLCMVRRAKRLGRIVVAPDSVRTSPRRYDRTGLLRNMLRNWTGAALFLLGVAPEKLVRFRG